MALETLLTSILLKSHSPTFFCRRRLSGRFAALPTYCALSESFLLNQLLPTFRQSSQSVVCKPLWIVCRCSTGTVVVLLRTTANGWVLVLWFPTGPLWARNIILVSNSAGSASFLQLRLNLLKLFNKFSYKWNKYLGDLDGNPSWISKTTIESLNLFEPKADTNGTHRSLSLQACRSSLWDSKAPVH